MEPDQHMTTLERLDAFRRELNWQLTCGALADFDLPVVGDDGGRPVVVALEDELYSTLLGRLRAVGGYANLFVRGDRGVRAASVIDRVCAIRDADEDMSTPEQRPGPTATVGIFMDYVEHQRNGVTISTVGHPALARDAHSVEFAESI